jgi:hypothetical protein
LSGTGHGANDGAALLLSVEARYMGL